MTIPAIHLLPLGICLGAAAVWDLAKRKIPNPLTAAVVTLGVGVQWWDHGALAVLSGMASGILSIAVLYRPWLAGGIGGGDVKLAAAVAVSVGLGHWLPFALGTALAGGVVAAACYTLSGRAARREMNGNLIGAALVQELPTISRGGAMAGGGRVSVPYGVAVAVGGALALLGPWGS